MTTIKADALFHKIKDGNNCTIIDVRTIAEYKAVHATGSVNIPLDELDTRSHNLNNNTIYFICKSGTRAQKAYKLFKDAGHNNIAVIEGGTDAWIANGLPIEKSDIKIISIERQVRIAAGILIVIGSTLGYFINPYFIGISAFVGLGLIFAGITDSCGMGLMLAKMPWNRR